MSRATIPGRPYRHDLPEYHVTCAQPHCPRWMVLTTGGEASTRREAETYARQYGTAWHAGDDWQRIRQRWYCPAHIPNDKRSST